jgi:ABC-type phosphate transport system substrate-binding protein
MSIIPTLSRLRQENLKLKASLGYIERTYLKKKKKKKPTKNKQTERNGITSPYSSKGRYPISAYLALHVNIETKLKKLLHCFRG